MLLTMPGGENMPFEMMWNLTIRRSAAVPLFIGVAALAACAQTGLELKRMDASEIEYGDDPQATVRRALVGDRDESGMYAYRVRFPVGTRVAPHYHPENRIVTVIEGSIDMGYGETFDESSMQTLRAGSVWSEPGNQPHYVWVKDEPVVIQIIGYGPTETIQVEQ